MTEETDAGVREPACQVLGVGGQDVPGDEEGASLAGRRPKPGVQGEVETLPDRGDAHEERYQAFTLRPLAVRMELPRIEAVDVPDELLARYALVEERPDDEVRRA